MGNIGSFIANSALASIKNSIKTANDIMQNFSLNDMGKAMDEAQERLKGEFSRFMNQIKNFTDKHVVEVPFNNNTDTFSFEIRGNILSINVRSKDESHISNHVFEIPQDVKIEEMSQSYDSERHILTFKFKRKE